MAAKRASAAKRYLAAKAAIVEFKGKGGHALVYYNKNQRGRNLKTVGIGLWSPKDRARYDALRHKLQLLADEKGYGTGAYGGTVFYFDGVK